MANYLTSTCAAECVEVNAITLLSGGAIQQNWQIDVDITGGPQAGKHTWVLRTDAPATVAASLPREREHAIIAFAHAHGLLAVGVLGRRLAAFGRLGLLRITAGHGFRRGIRTLGALAGFLARLVLVAFALARFGFRGRSLVLTEVEVARAPAADMPVAFVYSGNGAQWAGMGRELLADDPAFAKAVDELEPIFAEKVGFSLRGVLESGEDVVGIDRIQPVLVAVLMTDASRPAAIVNVAATLSSVSVSGPSSVNEGSSATYTATATWSDGSTTGVTPTWPSASGSACSRRAPR